MDLGIASFEEDLITEWFKDMENNEWHYKEPIVNDKTAGMLRKSCTVLQQDIHVFVNSVEILEDYIRQISAIGKKIGDPVLTIAAVIAISSKNFGDQDLKIKEVQCLLNRFTGKEYSIRDMMLKEIEILNVIDNKLAIETIVNDLTTLAVKFIHDSKIRVSIVPLCLDILEKMYLTRCEWFFGFKELYVISEESLLVFQKLICSRLFIPSAIVVYALKQTAYTDSLNMNLIMEDMACLCDVHVLHLRGFVRKLKRVFLNYW